MWRLESSNVLVWGEVEERDRPNEISSAQQRIRQLILVSIEDPESGSDDNVESSAGRV